MPSLQLRCSVHPYHPVDTCQGAVNFPNGAVPSGARWEEEEEEAVFIRGVNTNEDSPNAQHAPHRPVPDTHDTGAMSA